RLAYRQLDVVARARYLAAATRHSHAVARRLARIGGGAECLRRREEAAATRAVVCRDPIDATAQLAVVVAAGKRPGTRTGGISAEVVLVGSEQADARRRDGRARCRSGVVGPVAAVLAVLPRFVHLGRDE